MNELEKAAIISAIVTAIIAIIKFTAGTFFGSIALVADAIHSFTDIIGSIAVFFGIRFSEIKSKKFPYGLYKLENMVSLFLALLIFYTAFEILLNVIASLNAPVERAGVIAIAAAALSLVVSFILAKYKFKIGKKENSPSMLSEAKHTQLDAITTVGVLFAVSASYMGFPIIDPIIGFFVALLVFKAGVEIFIDSARVLLDVSLDYKTMKKIEGIVGEEKEIRIKDLAARSSGRYIFVDLKLETDIKDLKRVDQMRKRCEEKIKKKIPRLDKIMVETEYKKKDVLLYAVPLLQKKQSSLLAPEFGTAGFFGFFRLTNKPGEKKLLGSWIIKNPYLKESSKRGILAAELLAKEKVDILITAEKMHKGGSYYALQDNFVEMQETNTKTFDKILKKYVQIKGKSVKKKNQKKKAS